jgi:hypothetical protein
VGLALLVALLLYLPSLSGNGLYTKHIPSTFPTYGGIIGSYAPADVQQVSYDDFSGIRAINKSAIANATFLSLKEPKLVLSLAEVNARIGISLSQPNATVQVMFLTSSSFERASLAFNSTSLPYSKVGPSRLFSVADFSGGTPTATWLTLIQIDHAVAFSPGAIPAFDALSQVLEVQGRTRSSILSRQDVQRLFYPVDGTANHLAIGIQNFPGAVTTGQMTLVSVDQADIALKISYVVKFMDSGQAQAQAGYVKKVYLGAQEYISYDEFIQVIEAQPTASLREAIALVG